MRFPISKIKIPKKLIQLGGKLFFRARKIKPDACLIGGMIVGAATVGVAIKDTWDNKDILVEDSNQIKNYKNYDPEKEKAEHPDYPIMTKEEAKKLLANARKKMFADTIKAYWKTGVGTGVYVFMIFKGRGMMKRQIAELSAMYATLLESYRRYRENVIRDIGKEKDQEYMYGVKTIETIDAETGEIIKKTEPYADATPNSPYARWLNEGVWSAEEGRWLWINPVYTKNKLELEARIHSIQNSCNDLLRLRGFLTLNEVYRKLGFPLTEAGQHVGWVRGGFTDGSAGDDFVDFGVFTDYCGGKYQLPINRQFLDPKSNQNIPLLDFNVICLDEIWKNPYEYDNRSMVVYQQRKPGGLSGSEEMLDRWFSGSELAEEYGGK